MIQSHLGTFHLHRRALLAGALGGVIGTISRSARAQESSPVPGEADERTGATALDSMLRLVPETTDSQIVFTWADLATQLDIAGIPPLTSPDEFADRSGPLLEATQGLAVPSTISLTNAALSEHEETFGFSPVHIDQALGVGERPSAFTLLRGRLSEGELQRAWERSGYEQVERDMGTLWSFADGPVLDASSPVSRFGFGQLNNATILDDGTVVFAPTIALIEAVLAVSTGEQRSLADREDVATILTTAPPELVSAIALTGDALSLEDDFTTPELAQQLDALRAEQEAAVGAMPPVTLGLFGITGGLPPVAPLAGEPPSMPLDPDAPEPTSIVRLLTASTGDAAHAAEVVAYRWMEWPSVVSQRPLSDLMTLEHAEAHGEAPVSVLNFSVGEASASVWRQMIDAGDLTAFGP